MLYKNVAGQICVVYAYDTANAEAKTGDAANITAYISKDGGAAAQTNDVNPTELDATNLPGLYAFGLTQAETNCDLFVLAPQSSTEDIDIEPVVIYTSPLTTTRAGYVDNLDGHTAQTGDSYARLGAPAGASVSADIASIAERTDNLPDAPAATGDSMALTAAAIDAILDEQIGDSTITLRQAQRIMLAVLAGKSSGGGTTEVTFRNVGDDTDVVVATVDSSGNRSEVTLTL